jgi:exonuclease SbcD
VRLLHTSDWHIGVTTGRMAHARRPDHEKTQAELVAYARDLKPDLILHTGDLFHVGYPAVDDMRFGLECVKELAALAPVIVLRGNHDNDRLFRVFALLLGSESNLTFVDLPPRLDEHPVIRVPCSDGTAIALAPLPFVHANRFFGFYPDAESQTVTYADRLGAYERRLGERLLAGFDPGREVAVFGAHLFVQGAVKSGSERQLHVGDEYATRAGDMPAVSYAAFGHIHRPQRIPGLVAARYAGSPIPIDFGEEGEEKSAVFVDAAPGRRPKCACCPYLEGGHCVPFGRPLPNFRTLRDNAREPCAA